MKCMNCGHYKICKSLNNTGIFAKVSTALQAILADRGYKVLELKTFSGAIFVGTNIQIKFNEFLLTKCVYCNDELFSTIQNISEVRILFFS